MRVQKEKGGSKKNQYVLRTNKDVVLRKEKIMKKRGKNLWKKLTSVALSAAMAITLLPAQPAFAEGETGGDLNLPEKLLYFSFDEDISNNTIVGEGATANVVNGAEISKTDKKLGNGALLLDNNQQQRLSIPAGVLSGKNVEGMTNEGLTISYWSKVVRSSPGWVYFILPAGTTNNDRKYAGILDNTDKLQVEYHSPGGVANGAPKTNIWKHVMVTMKGTTATLYVDGKKIQSSEEIEAGRRPNGVPDLSGSEINIGYATWGSGEYFAGYIDEFTMYDAALTDEQAMAVCEQELMKEAIQNGFIETTGPLNVAVGSSVTIQPKNTIPENIRADITYQSANPAIATVDETGKVTGIGAGTTTITASVIYDGKENQSDPITINVKTPAEALIGSYNFDDGTLGTATAISTGLAAFNANNVEYGIGRDGIGKAVRTKDVVGSGEGYGVKLAETNLGSTYTVSMWINPVNEKAFHSNGPVLALGHGKNGDERWMAISGNYADEQGKEADNSKARVWGNIPAGRFDHNNKDYEVKTGTEFSAVKDQWMMLTIAQSQNDVSFYKDGELVNTFSISDEVMNGAEQEILLGVNNWDKEFDGLYDDVKVYNAALNASQIEELYKSDMLEGMNILGENKSIDMITKDLNLVTECNEVPVVWTSSAPEKITAAGEVKVKDGTEVTLTATASAFGNWSKQYKVRLAKPITVKHVDEKNTEIKTETVYGQVGTDYTYEAKDKILATDTAAYVYDETNNTAESLKISVTEEGEMVITVRYTEANIASVDNSKLPEMVYVIEGNTPVLPKSIPGTTASEGQGEAVTINVPISWTADGSGLKPGEHSLNGTAAGHAVTVKVKVFECDETVADTEAQSANDSKKVKLKKGYKGIIETEYDIVTTGDISTDAGVQYYDNGVAENADTFWLPATSTRFNSGYFLVVTANGKGGSTSDSGAVNVPANIDQATMLYDKTKTYHVRTRIDTTEASVAEDGTITKNGTYRVWITDEDGKTVELTTADSPAGFRKVVNGIIDKFGAAKNNFKVTNHKISWQSGYVTQKIESYVTETLEQTESMKQLPSSVLGDQAAEVYTYKPATEFEKDGKVYALDEDKSGWYKEDGSKLENPAAADVAVAGATVVYKAYYKEGANFAGLKAAIDAAQTAYDQKTAEKVYKADSLKTLQQAIAAAQAVYDTKGTANEKNEEEVAAAVTTLNNAVKAPMELKDFEEMNQVMTAYYPMDQDVKDTTANHHDGTVNGDVTFPNGDSAVFPGSEKGLTNYISLPTDMAVTNQMTFSFWTYTEAGGGNNVFGISSGKDMSSAHHFSIYTSNGEKLSANGGKTGYSGPAGVDNIPFAAEEWHLVTCVVNGTDLTFYVDGEEAKSGTIGASLTEVWNAHEAERNIYIGNNVYAWNNNGVHDKDYKGRIKNFRIYNAALAAEQVKDIYDNEAAMPMKKAIDHLVHALGAHPGTGENQGKYVLTITKNKVDLKTTGTQGETISWKAYDANGEESSADINTEDGTVNLPEQEGASKTATLKATIQLNGQTEVIEIICTIKHVSAAVETAREELKAVLDQAQELNKLLYTSASWSEFETILNTAQGIYDNPTTEAEIKEQTAKLTNAMKTDGTGTLVERGNKTELTALVNEAEQAMADKDKADYEESVWTALETAIREAKELSDDVDQAAVDAKKEALQTALNNFVPKDAPPVTVDKTALENKRKEAENAMKDQERYEYDKEIWTALETAINEAKTLEENADATAEEITDVYNKLEKALKEFQPKVIDKEALGSLKTEVDNAMEGKNQDDYDPEVWEALQTALKAVENLPENATAEEIKEAYKNLWIALDNFQPKQPGTVIPVESVSLEKQEETVKVNQKVTLKATVNPEDATNKDLIWESDNESVAAVDEHGVVTGKKEGTATITVSSAENKEIKATCEMTVIKVPVTRVTLSKTKLTLAPGKSQKLTATIAPNDATNKSLTWKSSNDKIAAVTNGKVTAKKAGTATITVSSKENKEIKATCKVTVKIAVTKVKLNKSKLTLGTKETFALKATITPKNATNKKVSYKSSKKTVATVSSKGKIKALKKGKTTITATVDGKKATCVVTVKAAPKKITLNAKKKTLKKGKTFQLKVKLPKNTASNKITYKTSNKKIATVSSKGKIKAVKKGKATITVTTFNKKKATIKITVK